MKRLYTRMLSSEDSDFTSQGKTHAEFFNQSPQPEPFLLTIGDYEDQEIEVSSDYSLFLTPGDFRMADENPDLRIVARGEQAVEILKRALFDSIGNRPGWQYRKNNGRFVLCQTNLEEAVKSPVWKFQGSRNTEFDFTAGGNRPDIKVSQSGTVLLVGEIKGRKDLSNTWESWMPQVVDHMRTWQREFPRATKGVCMTSVTQEMVQGVSIRGTSRTGLKQLFDNQLLDFVINLTGLVIRNRSQVEQVRRIFGSIAV